MNKRYSILVAVSIIVVCAVAYSGMHTSRERAGSDKDRRYPIYSGEELLKPDVYPYTFVFFGDNRPAKGKEQPEIFTIMIQMINEDDPLFVIGGGDFVVEGTPENFEEFLTVVSSLKPPLFYVCGNHDDSEYYEQYLGERVYAFTYKTSQFVILDNSRKVLTKEQLDFLEEQLQKKSEHTFVCVHVPPFDPEGSYAMVNPEEFMEIVLEYEVDYVLCSHIHSFYEEHIDNTTFIISGGAGAPLVRGGYHHYILIEVGDEITYKIVRCSHELLL